MGHRLVIGTSGSFSSLFVLNPGGSQPQDVIQREREQEARSHLNLRHANVQTLEDGYPCRPSVKPLARRAPMSLTTVYVLYPFRGRQKMTSVDIIVCLGVAFVVLAIVFFIHVHRRSFLTASCIAHNDDEASGPVTDHDEQDSLLPKFAGLLLSPWHRATTGQNKEPQIMHPVRNSSRSMSLPMSLPMGKRKNPMEVPIKKIHVPYFLPLLDETVEWWQMHQAAVTRHHQVVLQQETEEGLADDLSVSDRKVETLTRELQVNDSLLLEQATALL